ncbi:MAG: hypothetical protein LBL97_00755, partial [Prevotellaceae bacterium]|nr:hypothetical protein [Prevotellaceae bacterium]
ARQLPQQLDAGGLSQQPDAGRQPQQPVVEGSPCPLCGKGTVIKGKRAYGCSEWRNGCSYRAPFA